MKIIININNESIFWKCLLNPFKSCDCVLLYELILFSKETKQTLCCEELCCSCHLFSTMTVLIKCLLQLTKGMCVVVYSGSCWDRQASLVLIFGFLPGAPLCSFLASLVPPCAHFLAPSLVSPCAHFWLPHWCPLVLIFWLSLWYLLVFMFWLPPWGSLVLIFWLPPWCYTFYCLPPWHI